MLKLLFPRDPDCDVFDDDFFDDDDFRHCHSRWHDWGRWVLLAVAIVVFLLVLAGFLFLRHRRLRRQQIGGSAIPMNYQAPNHYVGYGGGGGGYYNRQGNEQGAQYERNYGEEQAPPPKYGEGLVKPDSVYRPPPK